MATTTACRRRIPEVEPTTHGDERIYNYILERQSNGGVNARCQRNDRPDRGGGCFLPTASFLVCRRYKASAPEKNGNWVVHGEASEARLHTQTIFAETPEHSVEPVNYTSLLYRCVGQRTRGTCCPPFLCFDNRVNGEWAEQKGRRSSYGVAHVEQCGRLENGERERTWGRSNYRRIDWELSLM